MPPVIEKILALPGIFLFFCVLIKTGKGAG
jgi:hypothetical protein